MSPKRSRHSAVGVKLWVPYRLQALTSERFIAVANRILRGENQLVNLPKVPEAPKPALD